MASQCADSIVNGWIRLLGKLTSLEKQLHAIGAFGLKFLPLQMRRVG
jgi:hypothetical protein